MRSIFHKKEHAESIDDRGYFRWSFLSKSEIQVMLDFYASLQDKHLAVPFHSTMLHKDPDYRKQIDDFIRAKLQDKLADLFVDYRILFGNYIVKKSSEDAWVGVHQDWHYVDESKFQAINIWVPLTDCDEQNGALWFLPGSHTLQTPIRCTPYKQPAFVAYKDKIQQYSEMLAVKAGEALVYLPGLIHFSKPNISGTDRHAIGMVSIPSEASPIHYYFSDSGTRKVDVYRADGEFFMELDQEKPPRGYTIVGHKEYSDACFDMSALDRLIAKFKNKQKKNWLKALFSGSIN